MKRTLEQKDAGCFFTEDQIDSLQLLFANFRVAHSIEPSMKAFERGWSCKDFSETSKIILTNMRIDKVVFPEAACNTIESSLLHKVVHRLFSGHQGSTIKDMKSFFQTLNSIVKAQRHVHSLENSEKECEALQSDISRISQEKERLHIENRILKRRLDNGQMIKQNL